MKKWILFVCAACIWGACGENENRKAQPYLDAAEAAWKAGDFNEAKNQIDSVRILFPKAFDARKAGVRLMKKVELDEQERTLVYLDSMLQVKTAAFDSLRPNYVLEKDTVYQEIGNYFAPTQTVEKNLNRTFLRAQVNELGEMSLTSIYCGGSNIHHTAVRVSVGDTYAETPGSPDIYETTNLGLQIEKADYPLAQDGGVSKFIVANSASTIQLTFIGDRNFKTVLSAADKKAISDIYTLAQVLSSIEQIKQEQQEANRKIQFIEKKLEQAESAQE